MPLSSLALVGVPEHDAGAASATLNATQQVGGSLGTALLNTLYTSAVAGYLVGRAPGPLVELKALIQGYSTAFGWSTGLLALATIVTAILVRSPRPADTSASTG